MFKDLDPLLHSQLRLAIVSLLITVEEADFSFIKEKTNASAGNISVQLDKLQAANYIEITKTFKGKYPLTKCSITEIGIQAFENYTKALQDYIQPNKINPE